MKNKREDKIRQLILKSVPMGKNKKSFIEQRLNQENYKDFQYNFIKQVGFKKSEPIIDIGSGMGGLLVKLHREDFDCIGLEPTEDYLAISYLRGARYSYTPKLICCQAEAMPIKTNSVTQASCFDVIEHSQDPRQIFSEFSRILRPGGKVLVTVPHRFALKDPHYSLYGINYVPKKLGQMIVIMMGLKKDDAAGNQGLDKMHYFTLRQLELLARRNEFKLIDLVEDRLKEESRVKYILYLVWRRFFTNAFFLALVKSHRKKA